MPPESVEGGQYAIASGPVDVPARMSVYCRIPDVLSQGAEGPTMTQVGQTTELVCMFIKMVRRRRRCVRSDATRIWKLLGRICFRDLD